VPSAATFSRAFAEFAQSGLADRVHQALIRQHLSGEIIGHISRDSTEIEAREKPRPTPASAPNLPRRRGRPPRGETAAPWPLTRLQRQLEQSPEAACAELAQECGVGCKLDSKGHRHYWIGYKAHLDVTDDMLPITVLTTSARVHDSQVAIPLARLTGGRVTALYELMDKAYDAAPIYEATRALGHVPLIAISGRTRCRPPLDPAQERRLGARSAVERVHARLKDEFGGKQVRVRGHCKVHAHLMFGILALFADQLLKLAT
jgi:IS5 family transposase